MKKTKKVRRVKAWAIVTDWDYPIPSIPSLRDETILYPSSVFSSEERAQEAFSVRGLKLKKESECAIVPCEITYKL